MTAPADPAAKALRENVLALFAADVAQMLAQASAEMEAMPDAELMQCHEAWALDRDDLFAMKLWASDGYAICTLCGGQAARGQAMRYGRHKKAHHAWSVDCVKSLQGQLAHARGDFSGERSAGMARVLWEISQERLRQNERWGVQNHPSVEEVLGARVPRDGARMTREYEIPSEERAKYLCELHAGRGTVTWAHIAIEELSEVVSADSDASRRAELIQLGAVIAAWVECIDRHAEKESPR